MLAPESWRRLASWICGWLYVVGQITITLAVNFGTTLFFVACVNVFEKDDGSPIWDAKTYQVFLIFLGITLMSNLVAATGNRWLPLLDVSLKAPRQPAFPSHRFPAFADRLPPRPPLSSGISRAWWPSR